MQREVILDGASLTLEEIEAVANQDAPVLLSTDALSRVVSSRKVIEEILAGDQVVYGVNTGFGKLSEVRIPAHQLNELQLNLIRSHSAGVGEPFSVPVTRAIMLLRANVLAKGHSGVRPQIPQLLVEMLNKKIHPTIPSKGSVGASGDLAPLAHLALVLVGEGTALSGSQILPGKAALQEKGLSPVVLQPKEGLALINGTQAMTAVGTLAWHEAQRLSRIADIAGALSLDVMHGADTAFDERIVTARPHPGALQVARNLRDLIRGSGIRESHRDSPHKVQDHYSLRCMPQVHGTVRDALAMAQRLLSIEINSATDNPLVFPEEGQLLSGGNFHGAPIAYCLDSLAIAVSQLSTISERRIALLIDNSQSDLPPFLSRESGLNSGFMIAHVTAAALVSENKILSHPASVDTIPTSANKEDHVSMGLTAALKLRQVIQNTAHILCVEILCGCQALDLLSPLKSSEPLQHAYEMVRNRVPMMEKDRILSDDMEAVSGILHQPSFLKDVESLLRHPL